MDWCSDLQRAVDYIEENLDGDIAISEAAKAANCSAFYFQRIFGFLCGASVGDYIRMRRLTLAGEELRRGGAKVIDIALKYGYDSPESFSRAFAKFHGVTPSAAKKSGVPLKSFSRVSVQLILKGGNVMDYRIEKKPAFCVLQKRENFSVNDEENRRIIPEFWTRCHSDGTVKTLLENTIDKSFIFGLCYSNQNSGDTFDYAIGAAVECKTDISEGFELAEIPERTWVIFSCKGAMPNAIQDVWHKICSEFFPASKFEPTYEMDIEAYTPGDMSSDNYESEIWVPIKEK